MVPSPPSHHSLHRANVGAGRASPQCAALLQSTDWAATGLGPMDAWPQSLLTAVSICLNSHFPMFVWWGPALVNIYNDAYAPMLGRRHPGAFGRPAREAWSDIWPVIGPQIEAVMRTGQASWNERVPLVMERNGFAEEGYFTWSFSPIYQEDGRIGGMFCACREETDTVRAERERDRLIAQAQDTARTLQLWFDSAPGFVALLRGPGHVFEMVNKAYLQLVGHRDILGKTVADALPEIRDQKFLDILDGIFTTGQPLVGQGVPLLVQPVPGGPLVEHFIDLVYQPVFDRNQQVTGIFVQGHDVTEQVRATLALKEADQRKDEFLATLAHELRNPLAPIRQAAMLAGMEGASPQRRAWALEVIVRQVGNMTTLIDDLLDVSRISRGKIELRLADVDLRDVATAAIETAASAIDARQHVLRVDLPEAPVRVRVDPVRIAQVLSNLLSNAAKYTDAGGRIVLRGALEGEDAVLSVQDNGIGLAPQDRERIFTMFSQVQSALDRCDGGLGIGLALSRGLVALHGGTLEARSEGLGHGAEFIVRLPGAARQLRSCGPEAATAGR